MLVRPELRRGGGRQLVLLLLVFGAGGRGACRRSGRPGGNGLVAEISTVERIATPGSRTSRTMLPYKAVRLTRCCEYDRGVTHLWHVEACLQAGPCGGAQHQRQPLQRCRRQAVDLKGPLSAVQATEEAAPAVPSQQRSLHPWSARAVPPLPVLPKSLEQPHSPFRHGAEAYMSSQGPPWKPGTRPKATLRGGSREEQQ